MAFKKRIYIAGPRMGQNNSMYGLEAKLTKRVKPSKSKRGKSNGSKKRS